MTPLSITLLSLSIIIIVITGVINDRYFEKKIKGLNEKIDWLSDAVKHDYQLLLKTKAAGTGPSSYQIQSFDTRITRLENIIDLLGSLNEDDEEEIEELDDLLDELSEFIYSSDNDEDTLLLLV